MRPDSFGLGAAVLTALALVLLVSSCGKDVTGPAGPPAEALSGGATTVFDASSGAFSQPAPNLSADNLALHENGDAAFERKFVSAPAPRFGGLGPVFNQAACENCHVGDGRGDGSRLIRLSVAGTDEHGGPKPVTGFGGQLQDQAVFGVSPEASVTVSWETHNVPLAGGAEVELRRPVFQIAWNGTAPAGVLTSPRVAPAVFGMGLLEAVPESEILSRAAEEPAMGVSGRPNRVWDVSAHATVLGRFGWKANEPTVLQQAADAYHQDMGITNPVRPVEACAGQPQDDGRPDDPEIDRETLEATAFYARTLGVPARRNVNDPEVRRGKALFTSAGCASCHNPTYHTGNVPGLPEISNQTIFPYTDLLLHDMGPDLADGRPDYEAGAQEWRTAPLWGIGLLETVNGPMQLLHDGRARTFMEAILWHGGEARAARDRVSAMPADDREALVAFLKSL